MGPKAQRSRWCSSWALTWEAAKASLRPRPMGSGVGTLAVGGAAQNRAPRCFYPVSVGSVRSIANVSRREPLHSMIIKAAMLEHEVGPPVGYTAPAIHNFLLN